MPTALNRSYVRALATLVLSGCGGRVEAPTADIDLSPAFLCEGNATHAVALSGKRSRNADGSTDGLDFAWTTHPAPLELLQGSESQVEWVARFDAHTPVAVELAVTADDGGTASRSRVLPLTRTTATPCSAGCLAHELCAAVGGAELCVEADTCTGDDECGCLECWVVDDGSRHCLAR